MKLIRNLAAATVAMALASYAIGADAELGIDAPPLKIGEWVKGKPVDLKDGKGKTVYVVEFWATWCPPCRKSIPHLTELQKKYADKDVVFIGVTDEVNDVDTVKEFVTKQGSKMEYTVAIDAPAKGDEGPTPTVAAYMQAFGVNGIPCAFIVDRNGKVAYVGNPADPGDKMDEALEQIVTGKWDLAAAKKQRSERMELEQRQMKIQMAGVTYFQTITGENADTTEAKDKARNSADEFVKLAAKDAQALNWFAWTLLTSPRITNRDLELGLKVAKLAYDACEGKDAAIVDTYARALFDSGKVGEAIKYQKKAIELCPKDEDKMLEEMKETLKGYEAKQPKE